MSTPHDAPDRSLNLAEYYLLTCLDDAGRLLAQSHTIRIGLAGAVLTDLARRGRINVTQDLVTVHESAEVDLEEPLDAVLRIIADAPEPQDAEQWINRFSRPALMDALLRILEQRGEIIVSKKRFLGLIPRTRYLPQESYARMDIYVRLRGTLMGRDTALDATAWPIVQLLYSTNVLAAVFPGEQNKAMRTRLNEFHEQAQEAEPAMAEALQAVENSIAEALTATRGQATGLGR